MEIFGLGTPELILILIVILLLFGKDKLPQLARSIGTSFKELKMGFTDSAKTEAPATTHTVNTSNTSINTSEKDVSDASTKSKK